MAQPKAYLNTQFLQSKDARALRILAEYLEPLSRFQRQRVQNPAACLGVIAEYPEQLTGTTRRNRDTQHVAQRVRLVG